MILSEGKFFVNMYLYLEYRGLNQIAGRKELVKLGNKFSISIILAEKKQKYIG